MEKDGCGLIVWREQRHPDLVENDRFVFFLMIDS